MKPLGKFVARFLVMVTILFSGCGGGSAPVANPTPVVGTQMGGARQGLVLNLSAMVTTIAGSGLYGAVDATGVAASFTVPNGVTTDGINVYVADTLNNKIRKIEIATGIVTTLAGSGSHAPFADGYSTAATFYQPHGITTDGINVYVSDTLNNKIRKIEIATGIVATLAGSGASGSVDATGTAASFTWPFGITTDGTNLYVADTQNSTIRKIVISTGVVTTLAGSGGISGAVDSTGATASFLQPRGITTDGINLYVADSGNHKIRQVVIATGVVTTLAGSGTAGSVDSAGMGASFNTPYGITTDGTNLYVADTFNNKIRKIVIATSIVTTLAGATAGYLDAIGTAALFSSPFGITTDGIKLYVGDTTNQRIRKIQ